MLRRIALASTTLVTLLTLAFAAPVSAAPKVHYQVVDSQCSASIFLIKFKIIKDQGVTGVTKFTMDASRQKFQNGNWKATTPNFTQASKQVSPGTAKATWTYGFGSYGPFSSKYRIVTQLRAWAGNNVVWSATKTSPTCGPF